jgi:hypothetical protein
MPAAPAAWTGVAAAASAAGEPQRRVEETAGTPPLADPPPVMQKTAGDPQWPAEVEQPEQAALAQSQAPRPTAAAGPPSRARSRERK